MNRFSRTEMLFGKSGMEKLYSARVAVFGIGGVGGYAVEALARSGVGKIDLFDDDKICVTNINRQIHASGKTVGLYKADVMKERVLDINPDAEVGAFKLFFLPETAGEVNFSAYDYIVDAIDTISGKIALVLAAKENGVPIISCMGAGNKMNAAAFEVADIYSTSVCPLAKVMRHELRKRGIEALKAVYSKEIPVTPLGESAGCNINCVCPPGTVRKCVHRRQIPGSNAFVPGTAGLITAGEVIKDLIL